MTGFAFGARRGGGVAWLRCRSGGPTRQKVRFARRLGIWLVGKLGLPTEQNHRDHGDGHNQQRDKHSG